MRCGMSYGMSVHRCAGLYPMFTRDYDLSFGVRNASSFDKDGQSSLLRNASSIGRVMLFLHGRYRGSAR